MIRIILALICLATPALAQQQVPPLDPAIQLGICQQQRGNFLLELEKAQAYATQFMAERDDLKKRLAEAEAKLSKQEGHSP